jgi:beta-N-acetylhexosaminidase
MKINEILNKMTLPEKVFQMFVLGFDGTELNEQNIIFQNALKSGLGGVIFFANNFDAREKFKKLAENINNIAKYPVFTSIDQEGGLVERTIKLKERISYLTPLALAQTNCIKSIEIHTQIMADELKDLGINMNFAPILDVNTNKNNPVIGIRSYGETPEDVIKFSKPVYETLKNNGIIPVGKHFPGHGDTWTDSHEEMPFVKMYMDTLEKNHISPFKQAFKNGLDAVMVAHVNYKAFDEKNIPASLSKNVIQEYLINKNSFNGLLISDDMVMKGISGEFDPVQSCKMAIEAGIDLFIYRNSDDQTIKIIKNICKMVEKGELSEAKIDRSVRKILRHKFDYGILEKQKSCGIINIEESRKKIDEIAIKTIKIAKKGDLIPLKPKKSVLLIYPDKKNIYNYSFDTKLDFGLSEETYELNPDKKETERIAKQAENYKTVIFISYNAIFNRGQIELFNRITNPKIAVVCGIPYDKEFFDGADSVVLSYGYGDPALRAVFQNILYNDF